MKRLLGTILLLLVLAGVGFWGYQMVVNKQVNINHWFIGGMVRGVDVSSYQGDVDFAALRRQGISFAYLKATEGSRHVDAKFSANWQNAVTAEMPVGAYHFFSYESSGAEQAENFIKTVGETLEGHLIPAVDMELSREQKENPPEKEKVVRSLKAYAARIEEQYATSVLIYATPEFYDQYLKDDFASYPMWFRSVFYPLIFRSEQWRVWQYDDRGELEGYTGPEKYIDLNVVNRVDGLDGITLKVWRGGE